VHIEGVVFHHRGRSVMRRGEEEERFWTMVAEAVEEAGDSPDKAYAVWRTGLLPTEDTWSLLSEEEWEAWTQALEEYRLFALLHSHN
jgi:hypothetical protein